MSFSSQKTFPQNFWEVLFQALQKIHRVRNDLIPVFILVTLAFAALFYGSSYYLFPSFYLMVPVLLIKIICCVVFTQICLGHSLSQQKDIPKKTLFLTHLFFVVAYIGISTLSFACKAGAKYLLPLLGMDTHRLIGPAPFIIQFVAPVVGQIIGLGIMCFFSFMPFLLIDNVSPVYKENARLLKGNIFLLFFSFLSNLLLFRWVHSLLLYFAWEKSLFLDHLSFFHIVLCNTLISLWDLVSLLIGLSIISVLYKEKQKPPRV